MASGLAQRDVEIQVSTLIYAMGNQADNNLRLFALSEEDHKKYATIRSRFDNHFIQRCNVIFERDQRRQEEGESVESFITSLYLPWGTVDTTISMTR